MPTWLRIDLRGARHALPHDCGSARARRIAIRRRLLEDPLLSGADALALAREMRVLELREAAEAVSLQGLR